MNPIQDSQTLILNPLEMQAMANALMNAQYLTA